MSYVHMPSKAGHLFQPPSSHAKSKKVKVTSVMCLRIILWVTRDVLGQAWGWCDSEVL